MTGPFTYLGTSLDAALSGFVVLTVGRLAGVLQAPLAVALSIALVMQGFQVLKGTASSPILGTYLDLAWRAGILAIALSTGLYAQNVVALVNGMSDALLTVFAPGAPSGYAALDQLEGQGASIATHYLALGVAAFPTGGYVDCLTGIAMAGFVAVLLMILGGYFLIAKVALALILSFGPMFLAAKAFRATEYLFTNWTNKLLNYVLLTALMTGMVALLTNVYGNYLTHLGEVSDGTNPIADAIDLAVLSGACLVLAIQMPRLAASLASGTSLSAGALWVILNPSRQIQPRSQPAAVDRSPHLQETKA